MKAPRLFYLILCLGCAGLLGFGYYLQFYRDLEPCPLCILQRVAYMAIVLISFGGLLHAPAIKGVRVYSCLIAISALAGVSIAGRQVWLQHLPADKIPECGPGLEYMLEVFSFGETLRNVFTGSGECAEVVWSFLSLSIAEWSLICFLSLLSLAVFHAVKGKINDWL